MLSKLLPSVIVACGVAQAHADCFSDAATYYGTPETVLRCLAEVESGNNMRAINRNRDGSVDMCAMQINSWWLSKLASYGINQGHITGDECTCIHVGAWILAHEVSRVGLTWRAVAQYHTGHGGSSEARGLAYARKVFKCTKEKGNDHRNLQGAG